MKNFNEFMPCPKHSVVDNMGSTALNNIIASDELYLNQEFESPGTKRLILRNDSVETQSDSHPFQSNALHVFINSLLEKQGQFISMKDIFNDFTTKNGFDSEKPSGFFKQDNAGIKNLVRKKLKDTNYLDGVVELSRGINPDQHMSRLYYGISSDTEVIDERDNYLVNDNIPDDKPQMAELHIQNVKTFAQNTLANRKQAGKPFDSFEDFIDEIKGDLQNIILGNVTYDEKYIEELLVDIWHDRFYD